MSTHNMVSDKKIFKVVYIDIIVTILENRVGACMYIAMFLWSNKKNQYAKHSVGTH